MLLDSGHGTFLPFNQITSTAMLICDDDESARVAAGMRLSGCPVLDLPGRVDRPVVVDVYVDRVPQDGVRLLVELRRLLGMAWPFSELRNLLATQPLRVGAGDLAKVRSALAAPPHLRQYLFYDTRGRLVPLWPDTWSTTVRTPFATRVHTSP
ncbi:hypothetical protein ACQP1P_15470 [Dactylosporangium sp. CA-052675]|uniref:hypothetical protein n=1 Tax=Dactylosporangium sp. CA-052675 TaxID=3239927 RepID=UPI003D9281EE